MALAAVLVVLGVLDAVWLATMVPGVYRPQLGGLLADRPAWLAAVAFYGLYAAGILVLVVLPALDSGPERAAGRPGSRSLRAAALHGALLGLVAYGTYDLTNLATLRDWPLTVTVIDMGWGMILTATASVAAVWAGRRVR